MSDAIIRVNNLGKLYRIGGREPYKTVRDTLMRPFRRVPPNRQHSGNLGEDEQYIWALKDVSFEVERGEAIGIIGRNGAGKTTLLRILSRITEPTEGYAEVKGRVSSLLEVGTGFHAELTGRENIYFNGSILGMRKREIDSKFEEIVRFAEVEKFIDTQIKYYSSGMQVRLAFAVAAHLEPEVLLVDEVLAVGDVAFQRKCLGRMEDVAKGGRTVLFVSHNMVAINHLCERTILLDRGHVICYGDTDEVVNKYLEMQEGGYKISLADRHDRKGSGALLVQAVTLRNEKDEPVEFFRSGETAVFELAYDSPSGEALRNVNVSFAIDTIFGQRLSILENEMSGFFFEKIPAKGKITCKVPQLPLNAGRYHFTIYITVSGVIADWVIDAGVFDVVAGDFFATGKTLERHDGVALLKQKWSVEQD